MTQWEKTQDPAGIEVLVISEDRAWRVTSTPTSEGLIERALDVAATVTEPWVAIVAGAHLGELQRGAAARQAGHGRLTRLRLAVTAVIRGDGPVPLVKELWATRRAAGVGMTEVVFAFRDASLENALVNNDRGPVRMARQTRAELVGLVARPDLDPRSGRGWSDNEVRQREHALFSADTPLAGNFGDYDGGGRKLERAGTEALLAIARDRYAWTILPAEIMEWDGTGREDLERLGLRLGQQLAGDFLFRVVRLPAG
jgi:hypothetical protein